VIVAVIGAVSLVFVAREQWWLHRVKRASGDPIALARLLGRRRRG
jgi:hypothetical protein